MFSSDSNRHYYLHQKYVSMSNGINGLYNIVKNQFPVSPVSGDAFVFFSKKHTQVKVLRWDNVGFILYYKRLEKGTFEILRFNPQTGKYELSRDVFVLLMHEISTKGMKIYKHFSFNKKRNDRTTLFTCCAACYNR